jgi:hypothetical protein
MMLRVADDAARRVCLCVRVEAPEGAVCALDLAQPLFWELSLSWENIGQARDAEQRSIRLPAHALAAAADSTS